MTLIELKKSLHEQIEACNDIELLKEIEKILNCEKFSSRSNKTRDGKDY